MYLILANTKSGNGKYAAVQRKVEALLNKLKIHFKTITVDDVGKIKEALSENLSSTAKAVVVIGGDSTVSEVINTLPRRQIPLAIVPIGSSNSIAKIIGSESVSKALEIIKLGRIVNFRLGYLGERFFLGQLNAAPRKNLLRKMLKRKRPLHGLLNVLGFSRGEKFDSTIAELELDRKLKFQGNVAFIKIKLENKKEQNQRMEIEIITKNEKGKLIEHILHASTLSIKAETNLPIVSGNDTIATTPVQIKALSRTIPVMVSKEFATADEKS